MSPLKRGRNPKKKGGTKKEKVPKEEASTTTTLSRILLVSISILVAVAAIVVANKKLRETAVQKKQQEATASVIEEQEEESPEQWDRAYSNFAFFLTYACQVAYCHDALKASKRIFRATRRIEPGEKLFEVPRSMQLWDLDALRDPFIRKHLFQASHKLSGNHLGAEAFLAAYLALQMSDAKIDHSDFDTVRLAYFDILPRLKDLGYHPILGNSEEMKEILGRSQAHAIIQSYRNMLISEYEAFTDVSTDFASRVSRVEYFTARLNVLTRAIRIGPPGPEEVIKGSFLTDELDDEELLRDELQAYHDLLGVNLMDDGCVALIPIADMFNHHPLNNVEYQFEQKKEESSEGSFVVTTDHRNIEEGFEPMVSYGIIGDAHLFGRYGFVNGDGSGHTIVSIAFHHDILKLNISSQYDYLPKTGMTEKFRTFLEGPVAQYLRYDDGYEECIPGPSSHPQEAELKRLKHDHLLRIANDVEKWTMLMPPRNPYSYPSTTTHTPISLEPPQFIRHYVHHNYNMDAIQNTCRLMSLINSDYDGKATQVLKDNLDNETFLVEPGSDDLEFRSTMCIGRWMGTGLVTMEVQGSIRSEFGRVMELNHHQFGTRNWTAYHVRFAEMQALQAAANLIFERADKKWEDKKYDPPPEYMMRDEPCPEEYIKYLFHSPDKPPGTEDIL
jgi:hypothetical protein